MRCVSHALMLAVCIALTQFVTSQPALAHSGGLNAAGCHGGSRPYHCHRSAGEMVKTQDGRNRLRCDLGSRSSECTRGSNSSAIPVLNVQIQLRRHCSGLPQNFADGDWGPATQRALIRFQRAYGLAPDGIYGQATARALASSPNGRC
ncbi:peptidoglycan-binding protein [Yoonia algicola]|uniref:peptidoglycan-binding protein n=1 Tax=Yoonia algicola TaxID=3137368 RepID=UPI003CC7A240